MTHPLAIPCRPTRQAKSRAPRRPPPPPPPHATPRGAAGQVYGAIYTLSRERWDCNKRLVAARLAVEHWQLAALALAPQWAWALRYGGAAWRAAGAPLFKPLAVAPVGGGGGGGEG
jgi:hypothetical protein